MPRIKLFGEFKLDCHTGILSRNGKPLLLTPQSVELLAILLETPGELVTREAIRHRLWPAENVQFEHSLDVLMSRLRTDLADDAKHPKFIQTIPRRGYRFIGIVDVESNRSFPNAWLHIRKFAAYATIAALFAIAGIVFAHSRYPTPAEVPAVRTISR
jgi:DNA-binding winged helix-turn-helix (wHTH) protein